MVLEYYDLLADVQILMYSLEKHQSGVTSISDLDNTNQIVLCNSLRSLCQRYHFGPGIDIISRYKAFENPHLVGYIRICCWHFDVELWLPLTAFTILMLNYLQVTPYQLTLNSYICLRVLSDLDKHFRDDFISLGQLEHYFRVQKLPEYNYMYMISKRLNIPLIFKNPDKTEHTDD